jgi:hypothetical protein
MRKALIQLGYRDTDHGFSTAFENPQDSEMCLDAMCAEYEGTGKLALPLPGIRQAPIAAMRQWRMPSQAVTDLPAYCFSSKLIEAYLEAKVILTLREIDDGYE